MHSPLGGLGLKDLEMEKSQLIEKANSIRTQLCRDAQTLQPLISQANLALELARRFKSANMAAPALFGLGVGGLAAIVAPKWKLIAPALKLARVSADFARGCGKFSKNA